MSHLRCIFVFSLALVGGCGRVYTLTGHNQNNLASPPDITMRVGDRKQVFWSGFSPLALYPAEFEVGPEKPGIVKFDFPDSGTGYMTGVAVGCIRVHYPQATIDWKQNKGFLVTVLPNNQR